MKERLNLKILLKSAIYKNFSKNCKKNNLDIAIQKAKENNLL